MLGLFGSFASRLPGHARPDFVRDDDDPIRSELFSVERLEQHAHSLAANQPVYRGKAAGKSLVTRLRDNERVLLAAYRKIAATTVEGQPGSPAAEWLLDNFHLVEQQVREVRTDLPEAYYRELPKLSEGPLAGYPRVLGIAWAFVAHSDSRFDPEMLTRFVRAYQTVQPLTIGELWAVAITLRIVLIENLRRSASLILHRRTERMEADLVADRLLGTKEQAPDAAALASVERMALSDSFVVQLVQRLREHDPEAIPAVGWLDRRLEEAGTTSDELVRREHQLRGATNVTVRNIITSMGLISDVDWAALFESVSPVDEVLRSQGVFADMDFATRNLYRTAVERLGRGTALSEPEIAQRALAAAGANAATGENDERWRDAGYHLIGNGRRAFERWIGYRPRGLTLRRRFIRAGISGYVVSVAATAAIGLLPPLLALALCGIDGWPLASMALAGLLPAIDSALLLVNRVLTGFGATLIPGMALREGVPADLRTMVVVPTLLTGAAAIDEQIERLEVHYLSNPAGAIHFALLSDWTDAAAEFDARRRRASRHRPRRHRAAEPPPSGRQRHRPLLPAPSQPWLESSAAPVDRLGAQARQAARAQPSAARLDRDDLCRGRAAQAAG